MTDPDRKEFVESLRPYVERAKHFSGWTFPRDSWLRLGAPPPWDYGSLVRGAARSARSVLNMGTGGGVSFSQKHLPACPIKWLPRKNGQ